jgi:sporulation integral membrane protein YtvI
MLKPWLYSLASLAGFLVVAYVLITYALPLVLPFVVALIVAELLDPIVLRMTFRGKVPRSLAVAVVLLFFVGLFTFAITAALGALVTEITAAITQLPSLAGSAMEFGTRFAEQFGTFNQSLPGSIQSMLAKNLDTFQVWLSGQMGNVARGLSVVSSLPAFVTNLLIGVIATFFIARDKKEISAFLIRLFPSAWHNQLRRVRADVWSSTLGWAKAQMMLILLTMIQTIIGLSLINAKYAVLMGIIVGVADMLPVLGPAAIYLPWIGYSFIFGDRVFGIKLLILYLIVAGIRQVLEAKVVGDQIGLHPLAILLSLYLGVQFFGGLGFVIGPLLAILLKSLIKSGLLPIFRDEIPKA